jgi:5S rRNA maturation endonuclease (ribonuclease M5)
MSAPVISPAVSAAERCQHSVAEILRVHNIVSPAAGSGYTTCPQCSALRKPANQKKQVLHVTVDRDGVQWFCNHCQWFGGELFEPRAGQMHLVASYDYRSENGELLFQTLRFFPKDFRQRRPRKGEWIWNLQGVRRVLYRLPELLAAKNADPKRPVFVVEGEKDADALQRVGATATCNPMGAGKWRDEYAEFLRGFEVVAVIADKDEPGRAHAQQVAASVAAVVKQVKVIELPGERVKDASDFIAAGGALQEIYDIAAATPDWAPAAPHEATAEVREQAAGDGATWPELDMRLVEDDCVPAPTLDNDALSAGWENWILSEAAARACPPDYVAGALIGAASGWTGNSRRIAATADWIEPAHLWFANIGVPSAGKTPALRPMIDVSRRLERDAEPAWQEAVAQYERDTEAATTRDKAWRENVQDAARHGRALPDRPADAQQPVRPPRPRLFAMDCSTEELQRMLAEAPRGLIYVRDELAGWLGSFDRYGGNGADRAFFLEGWNGGAYVCDRVRYHGEPLRIEHASLAIIGGMVPDRLREVLADADDGLTARLIFIWPEPTPITKLADRGDKHAALRRQALLDAAHRLRSLSMGADEHGAPAPIALPLDDDARQLFDEMRCDAIEKARSTHGLAAGWHGKNPGRALRLALVYEMLRWALHGGIQPVSVSADSVARAGAFLDYAARMLDRVTAGLTIGQAEADAAAVARHLLATLPERLNERRLYQTSGFAWARDGKRRAAALSTLQRFGWLRPLGTAGQGRPRGDWEVSPRLKGGHR